MEHYTDMPDSPALPKPTRFQGLQLWLVQSSVCVLAILLALCLKGIGGDAYTNVATLFYRAMTEHNLLSTPLSSASVAMVSGEASESEPPSLPANDAIISGNALSVSASPTVIEAPLQNGVLTSAFGNRADPFDRDTADVHHGVDIAAPHGTELKAMMAGTVISVGYEEAGYGHYVLVQTDDAHAYLYAHCSEILVKEADAVEAGRVIALVGSTGRSTGDHVHIEWRENGTAVDPSTVIPDSTYA